MPFYENARILISIPFWEPDFPDYRYEILKTCINEYRKLPRSHIVVHTQSDRARSRIEELGAECIVSRSLVHPFALTYEHRGLFRERIQDYEYFWYTEDDLLVRPETLSWYFDTIERLWPDASPALARTERNAKGVIVNTDCWHVAKRTLDDRKMVDGRVFTTLDNQYHACYGLPREILREYVELPIYHEMNFPPSREEAASFLIWKLKRPGHVEVTETGLVIDACLIRHVSNNYADGPTQFGKIPVEELVSWVD